MSLRRAVLAAMFGLLVGVSNVTTASAFCATIRATASGPSNEDALRKANTIGLADVRQLAKQYGNNVKYQPAQQKCIGANRVSCTITQAYCVSIPKTGPDLCPGDSVRNKQGKCVKDSDDPVVANPCSAGRIFSLSAQICHCPDIRPVWTGQSCISSSPVSGPTNGQIIQRCSLLDQECKKGITGSCRALKSYCDRG